MSTVQRIEAASEKENIVPTQQYWLAKEKITQTICNSIRNYCRVITSSYQVHVA